MATATSGEIEAPTKPEPSTLNSVRVDRDEVAAAESQLDGLHFDTKDDIPEAEEVKASPVEVRKHPEEEHNSNNMMSAMSEVRVIAKKGYGTFAVVDIPRGTRIISEKPLIVMEDSKWLTTDLEKAFSKLSLEDQETYLSLHSAHGQDPLYWDPVKRNSPLSPNALKRVEERYAARTALEKSIASIFQTNCMGIDDRGAGVFPTCARINHSCMPNAFFSFNSRIGKETIHSIKDIKSGEVITICYCDPFHDTAKRAWHMRHYGFQCECEACLEDQPAGSRTDMSVHCRYRLRELSDQTGDGLNKLFPSPKHLRDLVTALSESAMLLIQEELMVAELGRVYHDISYAAERYGDMALAWKAAENAKAVYRNVLGTDHEKHSAVVETLDRLNGKEAR